MKLLIAGGGTGGHIYPALSIAKEFQKQGPDFKVEFVGSPAGLETQLIPRENFKLHLISVGKLNYSGGVLKKIITFMSLPLALGKAVLLLKKRQPDFVLGVGGYVSGPVTLIASLMGYRTFIWEPNAVPGVTNRWLSYFVKTSLVVFPEAEKYLKSARIQSVGMPVRDLIEKMFLNSSSAEPQRTDVKKHFHILVFGGSQGARAINQMVQKVLLSEVQWRKGIDFRHQTGKLDYSSIRESYGVLFQTSQADSKVECFEYLHDMENQYAWADLIICRSGASTVAELAAAGKAALFIPLPWAADDHQKKNAESLVHVGAALMIEQKDLNEESLKSTILDLKAHPEKLQQIREKVRSFHRPAAAEQIVKIFLESVPKSVKTKQ